MYIYIHLLECFYKQDGILKQVIVLSVFTGENCQPADAVCPFGFVLVACVDK